MLQQTILQRLTADLHFPLQIMVKNCKVSLCIEYKIYFPMVRVSYWIKHSVDKKTKINGKWIMTRITISLKWKTH